MSDAHDGGREVGALLQHGVGDSKGGCGGIAAASRGAPVRQLSVRHLIKCSLRGVCRRMRHLAVACARLRTHFVKVHCMGATGGEMLRFEAL